MSDPETQVRFQPPAQSTGAESDRSRYERTPEQIQRRLASLDRQGRRCAANNNTCWHNAATREIDIVPVDPDTGKDMGAQTTVLSCSRHVQQWTRSARWRVVQMRSLVDGSVVPVRAVAT